MATITTSDGTEIHYKNWGKDPAVTMAAGTSGRSDVELKPGDLAPPFELAGSDGRVHRLREMLGRGRAVVIAWFPKAFTGG